MNTATTLFTFGYILTKKTNKAKPNEIQIFSRWDYLFLNLKYTLVLFEMFVFIFLHIILYVCLEMHMKCNYLTVVHCHVYSEV